MCFSYIHRAICMMITRMTCREDEAEPSPGKQNNLHKTMRKLPFSRPLQAGKLEKLPLLKNVQKHVT